MSLKYFKQKPVAFFSGLFLILCVNFIAAQPVPEPASFVKQLMQKYSPESYLILDQSENTPRNFEFDGGAAMNFSNTYNITDYLKTNTVFGVLNDINTAVHEMTHDYTGVLAYKKLKEQGVTNIGMNFYQILSPEVNSEIVVKITKTFPSSELANFIEDDYQSQRFTTYVFPSKKNQGTQVQGIYGLLDEFHAYYHGTKAIYDLHPYFENELDQTAENWIMYFKNYYATQFAFGEFKLFILKYLLYAKGKHPDIFENIMENKEFKEAFLKTDKSFSKMINSFGNLKQEILTKLKAKGIAVSENSESVSLDGKFAYTESEALNFFLQALNNGECTEMMALISSGKSVAREKNENTKSYKITVDASSMAQSFGDIKSINLIGTFNNFDVSDTRFSMTHTGNYIFELNVNLAPGKYLYKLNIDGMYMNNMSDAAFMLTPSPTQFEKDSEGGMSAVLVVQ